MKTLVKYDTKIDVPSSVAICPYCDGLLSLTVEEWSHNEDGTVSAEKIDLRCVANEFRQEPHDYWQPYIEWLPIVEKIEKWVNENYDFDLINWEERLKKWCAATRGV